MTDTSNSSFIGKIINVASEPSIIGDSVRAVNLDTALGSNLVAQVGTGNLDIYTVDLQQAMTNQYIIDNNSVNAATTLRPNGLGAGHPAAAYLQQSLGLLNVGDSALLRFQRTGLGLVTLTTVTLNADTAVQIMTQSATSVTVKIKALVVTAGAETVDVSVPSFNKGAIGQPTSVVSAVTLHALSGVITAFGVSTLATDTTFGFTVVNNTVLASSVVVACIEDCSTALGTNGAPVLTVGSVSAGSFVLNVTNAGSNALSGTLKYGFMVVT